MFLSKSRMALVFWLVVGVGAVQSQPRTDLYGDPLPPGALMRLGSVRLRRLGSTIAYSADGKTLISFSSRDKTIRHWDPATGRELRRIALQGAEQMKSSDIWVWNEKIVAMGSGEQLVLWDASTGKECRRIELAKANLRTLALSPSGDTLAAAMQADKTETVRLWDVASGKERLHLDQTAIVAELAFSPNGKLLGAVSSD